MIKIVDYGMGNCGSIKNMLRYLGADCEVITEAKNIKGASAIILPGVGSFDHGAKHLAPFQDELEKQVLQKKIPFLGICLGMQLLLHRSAEGSLPGLCWIDGQVERFDFTGLPSQERLVVPHMGWNEVWTEKNTHLLEAKNTYNRDRFYFVHSFHVNDISEDHVMARCHYGYDFVCAVQKENILGVQFHPEKSHKFGKELFSKFIGLSQC